jgi:hypothetical protein
VAGVVALRCGYTQAWTKPPASDSSTPPADHKHIIRIIYSATITNGPTRLESLTYKFCCAPIHRRMSKTFDSFSASRRRPQGCSKHAASKALYVPPISLHVTHTLCSPFTLRPHPLSDAIPPALIHIDRDTRNSTAQLSQEASSNHLRIGRFATQARSQGNFSCRLSAFKAASTKSSNTRHLT